MSQRKLVSVLFSLGCFLLLSVGHIGAASADRLKLNDQQLDLVDAGYLRISADAFALAIGRNAIAVTDVQTSVSTGRKSRHYSYSLGRASAYALAAGDVALTDVSSAFDTDEEIVRSRLRVSERSHGNLDHLARRLGLDLPPGVSFSQMQFRRLEFTIVTRVRLD